MPPSTFSPRTSGSTFRYWDVRAPPGASQDVIPLLKWCYDMEVIGYLMVLVLGVLHLVVFDVRKQAKPFKERFLKWRHQSR